LKSQYFDTFLFFKTGKFYEIFHMDADIAVEVLGLMYMKGHVAHAGFPEISYGPMADKLVRAGIKVARVEQTETPDMLAERKKKNKKRGGKTPKVVNREVCSILTLGTRTFCFLDDENGLTQGSDKDAGGPGPLMAIREIMHDPSDHDNNNDSEVRPVCEYGVTLIDAVRATVTIGQFADDVLRSRMNTLLTTFSPSEILLEAGENGASATLQSLIRSLQMSSRQPSRVEFIQAKEVFPKSTALDPDVRKKMERKTSYLHPWDTQETLVELHRRGYYPRSSRQAGDTTSVTRWPKVLKAAVEGNADLLLSSFGAALFYLQRNLIDTELLSMGIVKAYVPPASSTTTAAAGHMDQLMTEQTQEESGVTDVDAGTTAPATTSTLAFGEPVHTCNPEDNIHNMSLDGTTLHNLEILTNAVDYKVAGSLWSKINYTKTPHGSRLLRAWLLRPLFRKAEIDRRADAVQELVSGAGAVALSEAQHQVLGKIGDLERLLSRVHSMSGTSVPSLDDQDGSASYHPNDRAILYEGKTYTKRKVGDFSKLLNGLRHACQIPELFRDVDLQSGLLRKITKLQSDGGCFPSMVDELDWFVDNFDLKKAVNGEFEPTQGCDEGYDEACDTVKNIQAELEDYREEMCSEHLSPKHTAKSSWKYINTLPESKDKYLIELPVSVHVPNDFIVKGKR
jgi:DNA mismatch repair protein MSH6